MIKHFTQRKEKDFALLRNLIFWGGSCALITSCLCGCGGFFDSKPTALESQKTLREITKVKLSPNANIEIPAVYKEPPKIVEGTIGEKTDARLFYFTKHHTAATLQGLVNSQYVKKFFDAKGKPRPVVDYNVSINPATHQLIVRCPTVIDAEQVLAFLEKVDVQPIQVKIDCLISEVYADHTMDWETTIDIQNLFGESLTFGGKRDSGGNLLPAFPGAALRDAARAAFGLNVGFNNQGKPGHRFNALVDLLVSRGYVKILMNPTLEVVNGQTATIKMSEHVPLNEISTLSGWGETVQIREQTNYIDVIDSLQVTPHVFADGYIGLEIIALIGSKATPEGVKQTPIVTTRQIIIKESRIRQGESLVVGGIRKAEQRSVVRGVPFLKDIPILGVLFSSKDFEERAKEILFILTPTISSGGIPNEQMVADIQRKHTRVKSGDSILDNIRDPFGAGAYTELVEEEAIHAEVERIKMEMDKAAAERKVSDLTMQLEEANRKVAEARKQNQKVESDAQSQTKTANTEADTAKAEADKAKADAAAAQKLVEEEKAKAAKAKEENEKAIEEANKKTVAEKAKKEAAQKEKAQAEAEKAAAEKAKEEAEEQIKAWMEAAKEKNNE